MLHGLTPAARGPWLAAVYERGRPAMTAKLAQ
jgi:hypothetical protein